MKAVEFLPNKRSLAFSIIILLLFGIFFGGYFYYYIPANKKNLHHNTFLILQNIKDNIQDRNQDLQRLYSTFYNEKTRSGRNGRADSLIQRLLDNNGVAGRVISDAGFFRSPARQDAATHGARGYNHEVRLDSIGGGNLVYLNYNGIASENVAIVLPVENILNPVLQAQRSEGIGSYVLMSVRNNVGAVVYKDPKLGIRFDIPLDSLLPGKKNAFLAGIRDVKRKKRITKCSITRSTLKTSNSCSAVLLKRRITTPS